MRRIFFIYTLFIHSLLWSQEMIIEGKVSNERNKNPLSNIKIQIEGTSFTTLTNEIGEFILRASHLTHIVLYIEAYGFETKRIPIAQEHGSIELGTIFLLPKLEAEENDNLIALTETELADDEGVGMANALLRATRDVFLTRAAFDFGQAFFRVRGYDSQRGEVRINGLRMNKFYDGRPQWNQWGGLNDVTRNQEYTHGLDFNTTTFGGILGTTTIDTRPSGLRKGTRVSSSLSNRTYAGRIMASYNSGLFKNRLAFTLSASRRWAKQGYIEGTLYDAYSVYGSLEYQFNEANTLQFTGIYAHNRRGRSAAITEEVYTLKGKKYNPYWGEQNGEIRNSRERTIAEPLIFFNYYLKLPQFTWHNGISYSFGKQTRGRLGYFNAPNPDPTYYRYLPSFYVNSPLGANFESAEVSREAFLSESQINWQNVYQANENRSSYVLSDDTINDRVVTASSVAELNISDGLVANFGANIKQTKTDAYAKINDLFGQVILKDIDPFTNTRNDVNDPIDKRVGDIFNYHYQVNASAFDIFAQAKFDYGNLRVFGSIGFESTRYQRNGIYKNERYLNDSEGNGETVRFNDLKLKGGLGYRITSRHWVNLNAAQLHPAPIWKNVFVNPRENNQVVPNVQNESITSMDLNYHIRMPFLMGRISGFYTRVQNSTDINFFYVDSGLGSDFVQEILTDLDKLYMGVELGMQYTVSSSVKLTTALALSKYEFASNPDVQINFDPNSYEDEIERPIGVTGTEDLGVAQLKGLKLGQGPQTAFSFGIEYRNPKYWWAGATANYLAQSYAQLATIPRTQSFYINPETGLEFPSATQENVNRLLKQRPLGNFYLLNLVAGKSWLRNGIYASIFASVNNLFDVDFKTGGYEQARNGNFGQMYRDNLSGNPSFGPKFWYGYGRTVFINLAIAK